METRRASLELLATGVVGTVAGCAGTGERATTTSVEWTTGGPDQEAKLAAADDSDTSEYTDDSFGSSVALSKDGTTLLVGVNDAGTSTESDAGTAHVFEV